MRRKIVTALSAITLLSLVTGCAASSAPAESEGELTTLTVGALPILTTAAFRLGVEEGYFEEEGLNIEIAEAQSGAAISASVISGEYDIGFAAIVPQIQAKEENLPIKVIGTASSVSIHAGIVTAPDSDIKEPKDLEGARIGVVAMESIDELSTRGAADALGVDSSTFSLVSVPFPEMLPAVEAGRIDAAVVPEPFYTSAIEGGFNVVMEEPMQHILEKGDTNASFFASEATIGEKQEAIDGFIRALARANQEATENPDKVAELVPTYTSISPEVAEKMHGLTYGTEVTPASFETFGDLMVEYGWLDEKPNISELIYEGARMEEE